MPVLIKNKSYLTVAERLKTFHETCHDTARITTEIVLNNDEWVIMKASILDIEKDVVLATGHAEERRGSTNINQTSALENCETSAIGRALATFGLGGSEFASADEVANAVKQQSELENCECGKKLYPTKDKNHVRCYKCGFFRKDGDKLIKLREV